MTVNTTGGPADVDKKDFNIIDNVPNGPIGPAASTSMGWDVYYTALLKNYDKTRQNANIVQVVLQNGDLVRKPVMNLNPPVNQNPPQPGPLGYFFRDYGLYHYEWTDTLFGQRTVNYVLGDQFAITFQYTAPLLGNYKIELSEQQLSQQGQFPGQALPQLPVPLPAVVQKLQGLQSIVKLPAQVPAKIPPVNTPNSLPQFGPIVKGTTEFVFTDMPILQAPAGVADRQVTLQTFTITTAGLFGQRIVAEFTVVFLLEMSPNGVPTFQILKAA